MRSVIPAVVLTSVFAVTGCLAGQFAARAQSALDEGDLVKAVGLWRKAAHAGDVDAQFTLASMLSVGRGVQRDESEAIRWFRAAAAQGHLESQRRLGQIYLAQPARASNDEDAVRWMSEVAETGSPSNQYQLGMMYLDGVAVERDEAEALRWLRMAADGWRNPRQGIEDRLLSDGRLFEVARLGLPEAIYRVGVNYSSGNGVPQSGAEAIKWYRLAAEQGFTSAQMALADAYTRGRGLPQDFEKAAEWYEKAADLGDARAQYELGIRYLKGIGVKTDAVQAHKWFNLAAAQGHQQALDKRQETLRTLSPTDLERAEKLAVEFFYEHGGDR